jgi:ATP-binding cassette, subfamily C, bacterial CydD
VRDAADELARRTLSVLKVALLSSAALEALVTYAVAISATYIGLVLLRYVHVGWAPTTLGLRGGLFLLLLAPAFFQPFRDLAAAYHDRQDVREVTATLQREIGAAPDAGIPDAERGYDGYRAPNAPAAPWGESPHDYWPAPIVTTRGLRFRYPGADTDALHGVDWVVPVGAVAGVAGPSGASKTTLLRLVTGRLAPSAGSVSCEPGGIAWVASGSTSSRPPSPPTCGSPARPPPAKHCGMPWPRSGWQK